jgi:hypothetical protein
MAAAAAVTSPRERHAVARERRPLARRQAVRLFEPGRPTLDDRISSLWERLVADGRGNCPVCGTEVAAGRECDGCGSELT